MTSRPVTVPDRRTAIQNLLANRRMNGQPLHPRPKES